MRNHRFRDNVCPAPLTFQLNLLVHILLRNGDHRRIDNHLTYSFMNLLVLVIVLLLLFGGGGFYWGGPAYGGGGLGLVLLICLIILLTGGFRRK